ncbi:hypothetical protein B0H94_102183 [Salsuginibacillus halophilus]|uniref:Uncharacterized protein n=1 Tax=Salsuginibacillus halophilus TaxID=517424 RepID=A0A2P8HXE8_9BACI|nr:hypothetical protein [Salsuginibacillus halophilus]PSL50906.1 hypothetical protein B0H94_102183 [Salsuginibacillus halophilus]
MGQYNVDKVEYENGTYYMYTKEGTEEEIQQLQPTERLLTDSNDLAFVYIMDGDGFIQVRLPESVWPQIEKSRAERVPFVFAAAPEVELTGFHEELDFLLHNIPGNNNYGEEMEQAVTAAFSEAADM